MRFDNNSIKYKYDVDGIIDNAKYALKESEGFSNSKNKRKISTNDKPKRPNIPKGRSRLFYF